MWASGRTSYQTTIDIGHFWLGNKLMSRRHGYAPRLPYWKERFADRFFRLFVELRTASRMAHTCLNHRSRRPVPGLFNVFTLPCGNKEIGTKKRAVSERVGCLTRSQRVRRHVASRTEGGLRPPPPVVSPSHARHRTVGAGSKPVLMHQTIGSNHVPHNAGQRPAHPGACVWGRPALVASARARCPRSKEKCEHFLLR